MTPKEKKAAQLKAKTKAEAATCRFIKGAPRQILPCMPVHSGERVWPHRERISDLLGLESLVSVARSVRPKEARENPQAKAEMDKEWSALRELGTWNEKKAFESARA